MYPLILLLDLLQPLFNSHCAASVFESADSIQKTPVASKRRGVSGRQVLTGVIAMVFCAGIPTSAAGCVEYWLRVIVDRSGVSGAVCGSGACVRCVRGRGRQQRVAVGSPDAVEVDMVARSPIAARRLYEQGADHRRLWRYAEGWCRLKQD